MNIYLLLFSKLLVSLVMSVIVLSVLSRPLVAILGRICPEEEGAIFWGSYTKVMLVIAPFLLVLVIDFFSHFANPLDSFRLTLISALAGLLIGLHVIGKRIGQFATAPQ